MKEIMSDDSGIASLGVNEDEYCSKKMKRKIISPSSKIDLGFKIEIRRTPVTELVNLMRFSEILFAVKKEHHSHVYKALIQEEPQVIIERLTSDVLVKYGCHDCLDLLIPPNKIEDEPTSETEPETDEVSAKRKKSKKTPKSGPLSRKKQRKLAPEINKENGLTTPAEKIDRSLRLSNETKAQEKEAPVKPKMGKAKIKVEELLRPQLKSVKPKGKTDNSKTEPEVPFIATIDWSSPRILLARCVIPKIEELKESEILEEGSGDAGFDQKQIKQESKPKKDVKIKKRKTEQEVDEEDWVPKARPRPRRCANVKKSEKKDVEEVTIKHEEEIIEHEEERVAKSGPKSRVKKRPTRKSKKCLIQEILKKEGYCGCGEKYDQLCSDKCHQEKIIAVRYTKFYDLSDLISYFREFDEARRREKESHHVNLPAFDKWNLELLLNSYAHDSDVDEMDTMKKVMRALDLALNQVAKDIEDAPAKYQRSIRLQKMYRSPYSAPFFLELITGRAHLEGIKRDVEKRAANFRWEPKRFKNRKVYVEWIQEVD